MPGSFIDTNVLVYLASSDDTKAVRTEEIIATGGMISVQVLNELANVARRNMRMSWGETHRLLDLLRSLLTVHPVSIETHETGLALAERYRLSIYDAMIFAAAIHAGCDRVWSEGMHDSLVVNDALEIANPFRAKACE